MMAHAADLDAIESTGITIERDEAGKIVALIAPMPRPETRGDYFKIPMTAGKAA